MRATLASFVCLWACGGGVHYRSQGSFHAHGDAAMESDEPIDPSQEEVEVVEVVVVEPPPPPRVEVRPAPPGGRFVWVEGHWALQGPTYVWIDGTWSRPRRAHRWVRPRVERRGDGWVFVRAHWEAE